MFFNTYLFIIFFLPIFLITFYFSKNKLTITIFFSLLFYLFNSPNYFLIFLFLLILNYFFSLFVKIKLIFIFAVISNLSILIYFKYLILVQNFFYTGSIQETLILPLGISFYTFNNIIFLFDCKNKLIEKPKFTPLLFLVSFFPHMIAGPFIRISSLIHQVKSKSYYKNNYKNLLVGLIIFILGLSKKVFLADSAKLYVDHFFNKIHMGLDPGFLTSWVHSTLFLFQLYFDFSGYSDMAIGLALMCNILLPINFDSPLKSKSIIQFWQRWHITLTQIIYEFIFFPISIMIRKIINIDNSFLKILTEKFLPIMLTFLIIGLWHGGSINFIIFGILNGFLLFINHMWRDYISLKYLKKFNNLQIINIIYWILTFFTIVICFVFFRSENFSVAYKIISGMMGVYGFGFPEELSSRFDFLNNINSTNRVFGFDEKYNEIHEILLILLCFIISLTFKNLNSFSQNNYSSLNFILIFRKITFICLIIIFITVVVNLTNYTNFIYFNF